MASLYVGNLDDDCTETVLYHKFSEVGILLNIRHCRDKDTGRSLGYGFINYSSKTDAEKAINTLNYTKVKGRTIRLMKVEKDMKKLSSDANIIVKNLVNSLNERSLCDIFGSYGTILSVKVAKNIDETSRGFAFIQFAAEESAEEAIKGVNGKMIFGKPVNVAKFLPKSIRQKSDIKFQNVYIKNFGPEMADKDLVEMCKDFGEITSAKVMLDEDGTSKCFGFVCFKNSDSAKAAIKEINGKTVNGRRLFADRAKKKAERHKEIRENFKRRLNLENFF